MDIYEYLALAIDLEGTIGIMKVTNKTYLYGYYYTTKINVGNTNKEILEHIKNKIKFGKIYGPQHKNNNKNHKDSYVLVFNREELKEHLPKILPFLIIKWRQAELAIELLSTLKDRKFYYKVLNKNRGEMYTWEEWCIFESIYKECKELNKKGNFDHPSQIGT